MMSRKKTFWVKAAIRFNYKEMSIRPIMLHMKIYHLPTSEVALAHSTSQLIHFKSLLRGMMDRKYLLIWKGSTRRWETLVEGTSLIKQLQQQLISKEVPPRIGKEMAQPFQHLSIPFQASFLQWIGNFRTHSTDLYINRKSLRQIHRCLNRKKFQKYRLNKIIQLRKRLFRNTIQEDMAKYLPT